LYEVRVNFQRKYSELDLQFLILRQNEYIKNNKKSILHMQWCLEKYFYYSRVGQKRTCPVTVSGTYEIPNLIVTFFRNDVNIKGILNLKMTTSSFVRLSAILIDKFNLLAFSWWQDRKKLSYDSLWTWSVSFTPIYDVLYTRQHQTKLTCLRFF
jgi:hypothetical protein